MIFYVARDENGHRQLRGTQADARAVNKQFEQIDIPVDKANLMAFVQALFKEIDEAEDIMVEDVISGGSAPEATPATVPPSGSHPDCPRCKWPWEARERYAEVMKREATLDGLVDFIAEQDPEDLERVERACAEKRKFA